MRCAAHPARPARDRCPRCGRPRCAADHALGECCAVCRDETPRSPRPAVGALAGAGAAGTLLAVVGGALGQEYVGAHWFSVLFPALVGIVIAAAAAAAAGPLPPVLVHVTAAMSGGYAALSALLDFRFTDVPFGPVGRWLPPLLAAAVAGVVAAELLARRPVSVRVRTGRAPRRTGSR